MKTVWQEESREKSMISPLSLIITAFAPVPDISKTLTPQLQQQESRLILIDLGGGKNRLGGSVVAQVYRQLGNECPDLDDSEVFKRFFTVLQTLNQQGKILAYHDRSDGGLLSTLCEMHFAGRVGLSVDIEALGQNSLAALFNEELGAVIQVSKSDCKDVLAQLNLAGLAGCVHSIGQTTDKQTLSICVGNEMIFSAERAELQQIWSETSFRMQALRDNPDCAQQQYNQIVDDQDPGLHAMLSFDVNDDIAAPFIHTIRPKIAILREQGVNGHVEMAAAFDRAGFKCMDVHMSDFITGRVRLSEFSGLAACGGFSYGDVLGAGGGWAKSILFNDQVRDEFSTFFNREDTFGLGVCNGCQMLSNLRELIPGTADWPRF
jgi:phosphoribosylformylglycinamidine synthase